MSLLQVTPPHAAPGRLSFEGANYRIKRRQNGLCINSAGTINGFSLAIAMHSSCVPPPPRRDARILCKTIFRVTQKTRQKKESKSSYQTLPINLVGQLGVSVQRKHLSFGLALLSQHAGRVFIRFLCQGIFIFSKRPFSLCGAMRPEVFTLFALWYSMKRDFRACGIFGGSHPLRQLHGPMLLAVECQLW